MRKGKSSSSYNNSKLKRPTHTVHPRKGAKKTDILVKWKGHSEPDWNCAAILMEDVPYRLSCWARREQKYNWKWLWPEQKLVEYDEALKESSSDDELFGSENDSEEDIANNKDDNDNEDDLFAQDAEDEGQDAEVEEVETNLVFPTCHNQHKAKQSSSQPSFVQYAGEEITVVRYELSREQYFLKYFFGSRLHIVEYALTPDLGSIPKQTIFGGATCQLVATKLKRRKADSYHELMERKQVKALKIKKKQNVTVKSELESIGCFDHIIPGKVAARMELTVSPIAWGGTPKYSYPLSFNIAPDQIELIEEVGNEGCGFVPHNCEYPFASLLYSFFLRLTSFSLLCNKI